MITRLIKAHLPQALATMALSLGSCQTPPRATAGGDSPALQASNEGYSLLHELLLKQQNVDKALWLRTVDPEFSSLIKEIAEVSRAAREQLDDYSKDEPALRLELKALPEVERDTRAAIQSTETQALLGSRGPDFQRRLLLTQASSMQYASHLAQVLSERETDESRKTYLSDLAKQLDGLNARAIDLLVVKPPMVPLGAAQE